MAITYIFANFTGTPAPARGGCEVSKKILIYVWKKNFFIHIIKIGKSCIFGYEKKIIALAVFGTAAAWWLISKVKAARSLEYKITSFRVYFYPDEIRVNTNIQLTNKGSALNLQSISGSISINGKEVGRINQAIKLKIKPGISNLPLNFSTRYKNLELLFLDRSKFENINFAGSIKAEGFNIPVNYNYVPWSAFTIPSTLHRPPGSIKSWSIGSRYN